MGEILGIYFLVGLLLVIVVIVIACCVASSGTKFSENSQKIQVGMSVEEVRSIMGEPSYVKNHQDGSYEYVYEKSEWKGALRGGTKVRRMEIVISSNHKVISVGRNENCDMSGF